MSQKNIKDTPTILLGRPSNTLKMGIVGLPNVGKSTFFNVLTRSSVPAENRPFCTINPSENKSLFSFYYVELPFQMLVLIGYVRNTSLYLKFRPIWLSLILLDWSKVPPKAKA